MKGEVLVDIRTANRTVEFPDLLRAKEVEQDLGLGGAKLLVHHFVHTRDGYSLKARLTDPSQKFNGLGGIQGLIGVLVLKDAKGQVLRERGLQVINENAGEFSLDYDTGPLPPSSLEWIVPTQTKQLTVPIEFEDLPLP